MGKVIWSILYPDVPSDGVYGERTMSCPLNNLDIFVQNDVTLCIVGTGNELHAVTSAVTSVSVAGVDLLVANDMKALGVVLDRRLSFRKHAMAVARSCNYHSQAIRHICHLLSTELAVTLACSLILTKLDYCNSLLYGAPASSIQVMQRVQNNAARIVLQAPRPSHARPLLHELHWLPIQHRIEYKVAVLNFKSRSSATAPTYLSRHIKARVSERTLRSSAVPLLDKPFTTAGQTSRDELFVVLRQLSGTRCLRQ